MSKLIKATVTVLRKDTARKLWKIYNKRGAYFETLIAFAVDCVIIAEMSFKWMDIQFVSNYFSLMDRLVSLLISKYVIWHTSVEKQMGLYIYDTSF